MPVSLPLVDRRHVLGGLAVTLLPLPATAAAPPTASPAAPPTTSPAVSPTASPLVFEAGPATLTLQPKSRTKTQTWAYNAKVPGPLVRVRKGEPVHVRLVNRLDQPTSLCWHGVRIANAMDGVAGLTQAPVPPGGTFDYLFTPPDAGLYWYHPHVWPHSAEQIDRGLYGVLIVDEAEPPQVDEDLLAVIDDWSLDADGQIADGFVDAGQALGQGRIGSLLTVDTKPAPLKAEWRPGARVRLRLLNACSARIAVVGVEGATTRVVALDGQPSELFRPARDTVPIGPGARFEMMLDVPADAKEVSVLLRGEGGADRPLLRVKIAGKPLLGRAPVAKLPDNPLLPTRIHLEKSLKKDLVVAAASQADAPAAAKGRAGKPQTGKPKVELPPDPAAPPLWTLGGIASDGFSGKPLFKVKRGMPVTLAFVNKAEVAQQMHVHGHAFRVLHDMDDGWDPYWRDCLLIAPGKTKHVAFVADNPGKWAVESLVLDRQVTGLAAWFEVS